MQDSFIREIQLFNSSSSTQTYLISSVDRSTKRKRGRHTDLFASSQTSDLTHDVTLTQSMEMPRTRVETPDIRCFG
jgi:hypothetical protein